MNQAIATSTVKGHQVSLGSNGVVYFGRDLYDELRDDLQGVCFRANTLKEFDDVCKLLSA